MWLTTKDGRHFNTDWMDEDERKKYAQIEANEKQARELMGKKAYDPLEKAPGAIWRDEHLSSRNEIRKQWQEGKITKEKMWEIQRKMDDTATRIAEDMVNRAEESNLKALYNTMNRKLLLTSDKDISGSAELHKTANGFVLIAPGTRGEFRLFMDDGGTVRRMPDNEMKTAHSKYSLGQRMMKSFENAYNRYDGYQKKKGN